jgi:GT2 family glycosyltransferase
VPGQCVAAVVPNRNGGEALLDSLTATLSSLPPGSELWLVDDASDDGSPDRVQVALPQVRVLALDRHRGAAHARNRGLQAADAHLLLCVDADVECQPGCLPSLLAALETADVAFPTLRSPDGEVLTPRTAFARRCCLNSAVFGIRRDALDRMDSWFDETIEVYGEDNDFFLRAQRLGLRFCHVPDAQAIHPRLGLAGERHYYLTVRNAVYVWLKLRRLVAYWMPMDAWIAGFLASQLAGALCNRSLGHPRVRYTEGPRWRLLWLFGRALAWNVRHVRHTLGQRRAFRTALEYENPDLQLA